MRYYLLSGLSLLAFSSIALAQSPDQNAMARKLTLAKQYSEIVPVEDEVSKAIESLVVQVPKDNRVLFQSILERNIKVPQLKTASEVALSEVFTEKELQALIAFYSTEEGRAVREKMPVYQERLQPVLEQMVRDALEAYQRQTQ